MVNVLIKIIGQNNRKGQTFIMTEQLFFIKNLSLQLQLAMNMNSEKRSFIYLKSSKYKYVDCKINKL